MQARKRCKQEMERRASRPVHHTLSCKFAVVQFVKPIQEANSSLSSTNFLSLSSDPINLNEFVTAAVPFSTLVIT